MKIYNNNQMNVQRFDGRGIYAFNNRWKTTNTIKRKGFYKR